MSSTLITRTPIHDRSTSARPGRDGLVTLAIVGALTLAAFLLRLTQMDQSLFGDEVLAYREVTHHGLSGVVAAVRHGAESSPPLFFVLAWLSAKLGDPTVWIRLPSLLLSTATIPLTYLIGRDTLGRTAGLLGAAVLAVSPFSAYYGIEARPYATTAFFVTLSTLALIRAVGRDGWRWWAAYAVAAAAAAYSHYTAVFVLVVQAAWSFWTCRGRIRSALLANLGVMALYAPWLPEVHGSRLNVYALLEPLTVHHVVTDVVRVIPGYPYAPIHAIPTIPGLVAVGVCALIGALYVAFRRVTVTGRAALVALTALATPVGVLLYSLLRTDIWDARDLYASAPALALVLGGVIAAITPRLRVLAAAIVFATLIFGTVRAISPSYARPPFRVAASYLDRVARPHDPILMASWAFVLDQAIPAQFKRPHRVLTGLVKHWPDPPPGGHEYVVVDQTLLRLFRTTAPRSPGFTLIGRRNYNGLVSFSIFTFRRSG